jgi:hypothetical protein
MARKAIIIGAGPAGLTAGLEFLRRSDIVPVILEASNEIGGISRTIRYKGNRMDIGGHRFFSKSDRVMQWWMDLMPPDACRTQFRRRRCRARRDQLPGQEARRHRARPPARRSRPCAAWARCSAMPTAKTPSPGRTRRRTSPKPSPSPSRRTLTLVMLIRPRRSRIYYLRKFFDYPITLTANTLKNLGVTRMARVGASYMISRVHQIKPEKSLEDFLINRFGRELYLTFFKSYTEKVWGTPCHEISAEWGAQRIKGLSLTSRGQALCQEDAFSKKGQSGELSQKGTDTSLIERFMYPKFGPGQLWEHVADLIARRAARSTWDGEWTTELRRRPRTPRRRPSRPSRPPASAHLCRRLLLLHHAHARTAARHADAGPGERAGGSDGCSTATSSPWACSWTS